MTLSSKDHIMSVDTKKEGEGVKIPESALHDAIANAMSNTMKYDEYYIKVLLQEGANPNTIQGGLTPLTCATMFGHKELVLLLLQYGANPNLQDDQIRDRMTPLHWAGPWGRGEITSLLLQYGADPNAPMKDGWTPLHCATLACNDDVVQRLINNNNESVVDVTCLNDECNSAFSIARGKGDVRKDICRQLMRVRLMNKSKELQEICDY